jgi:drug/metabolite transporter (DMT)-like permease
VSHTVAGYALIVLAACFWGGSSSLGKRLLQAGVSTVMLTEARTLVSAIVVLVVLGLTARTRLRIRARDLPALVVSGIALALVNLFYYEAIKRLPIATAVFIQFTAPAMVFAYGVATGRERPHLATGAALLLSMAGTYLMVGGAPSTIGALPWVGLLAALGSAVTYAFCIVLSHRLARRLPTATIVAYGWCVAALVWALVQSVPATVHQLAAAHLLGPTLLFACTSMLIPLPLFTLGIGRVSATGGAIASSSETVAASTVAFLVLGEALTGAQLAGGALILTAVLLLATRSEPAFPV